MKTKQELQEHCKQYIENINLSKCNIWEEKLVKRCREDNYQFGNYLNIFYNPITEENFSFTNYRRTPFLTEQTSLTFFPKTFPNS